MNVSKYLQFRSQILNFSSLTHLTLCIGYVFENEKQKDTTSSITTKRKLTGVGGALGLSEGDGEGALDGDSEGEGDGTRWHPSWTPIK